MTAHRAAEAGDPAALDAAVANSMDAAFGRQLFVYYRVNQADLDRALTAARTAQAALISGHADLTAALWRRPDVRDQQVTVMETYSAPAGLGPALAADIERQAEAGAAWRCGERHCEWFDPA